jgi:hypothetical protein
MRSSARASWLLACQLPTQLRLAFSGHRFRWIRDEREELGCSRLEDAPETDECDDGCYRRDDGPYRIDESTPHARQFCRDSACARGLGTIQHLAGGEFTGVYRQ